MKAGLALSVMALAEMMAAASTAAGGEGADSGLVGRWSFDEGQGVYSANAVDATGDAELHGASWTRGQFGTALRLTGSDSYAILPAMPQLDGSDEMSLTVWVYWEGTGQYPNILTGGTWSPGGFLIFVRDRACSFRMGRPGHRHGVAGEAWTEGSAPLLADLPLKQWVHLAAVFKRPEITTYVDGKKVGSARWDYPVGQSGDLQVGRWSGSASHAGLIDELRIYRRALEVEEVLALALRGDPAPRARFGAAYRLRLALWRRR